MCRNVDWMVIQLGDIRAGWRAVFKEDWLLDVCQLDGDSAFGPVLCNMKKKL